MINKFLITYLVLLSSISTADAVQMSDIQIQTLILWEKKIDEYLSNRVARFPTATHEFERRVVFFDETIKIIEDLNSHQRYRSLLAKRIAEPAKIYKEHQNFYGFLYCVLAGVDYSDLLKKQKANDAEINQMVLDILILGKNSLSKRNNFRNTKSRTLKLLD